MEVCRLWPEDWFVDALLVDACPGFGFGFGMSAEPAAAEYKRGVWEAMVVRTVITDVNRKVVASNCMVAGNTWLDGMDVLFEDPVSMT